MGYSGSIIPIPVAQGGLLTDLSPDRIPPSNLMRATNVQIRQGIIEKSPGSLRWSAFPLSGGIIALYDFWPLPGIQYTIAVTRDGRVWRFRDKFTVNEIIPDPNPAYVNISGMAPSVLSIPGRVQIVQGGQEFVGAGAVIQPRKLFIFTGGSPIQVINGTDLVRHNLLSPAADWNGYLPSVVNAAALLPGATLNTDYPNFGFIYLNRLFVLGNENMPHFSYASSDTVGGDPYQYGHEDFSESTFNTALFNVYPGDGDRNQMLFSYKTKLWLLKYPKGLYSLNVPDIGVPADWYFEKVNDDVGTATITGIAPILDDVWVMNSVGAIQSLTATLNLGGVISTNVLRKLQIEKYIQQITSPLGVGDRQALWHQAQSTAYFLYRPKTSRLNSLMIAVDLTAENPKATIITKDQPNTLALRKDVSQVEQVMYGSEDGYIYFMDYASRFVGTIDDQTGYQGEFQTPNLILVPSTNDYGFNFSGSNDKLMDFVEIEYIPTGDVTLNCDIMIDGRTTESIQFLLSKSNELGQFILNQSRLQGRSTRRQRKPIHGRGRTVSLKFYDNGGTQDFKITGITVYARLGGVDEKGSLDKGTQDNF